MTNKELFDNNNEEIDNHDSTWKEFADAEIKWDLDALKQHVHHESNEHALDIERQLWEIKTDVLLQSDNKKNIESIPHHPNDNEELMSRANVWRKEHWTILINTFDKKIQNNTHTISEAILWFIVTKIFRKKSLSEL